MRLCDVRDLTESEFKAKRREAVQATDIAALLGVSQWKSALDVWREKVEGVENTVGKAAEDGRMLEGVLIKRFCTETGIDATATQEMHRMANKPIGCTLDGIVGLGGGEYGALEIKAVGPHSWDDWQEDQPPAAYHLQVQQQLLVTGFSVGYLYAWSWGQGTRTYKILPDERVFEMIIDSASKFWSEYVVTKLPPLDNHYFYTSEDLKALYPKATPKSEVLLEDCADALGIWDRGSELIKQGEGFCEDAKKHLMRLLGEHEIGIFPGGRKVRWSNVESNRLNTSLLKTARPEIYQEFCELSHSRRFTIGKGE